LTLYFTWMIRTVACTALPVLLFSCTAPKYVYSPSTANLLSIAKKGDAKLALNYSTAGNAFIFGGANTKSNGGELQAAVAAGNKIVIRGSAYIKKEHNQTLLEDTFNTPWESNSYRKRGAELSVGIYNFSKSKAASVFQLNGGIGFGKSSFTTMENEQNSPLQSYSVDYIKAFMQPAAIIKVSENYKITLGNTFSLMSYKNVKTDLKDIKEEALGYIDSKPGFFSEFIFQNEFEFAGLSGISFQVQFGTSSLLTSFSSEAGTTLNTNKYAYHKAWSAIGIAANFGRIFRKGKK